MDLANHLSVQQGYIKHEDYKRIRLLLQKNWDDVCLPSIVMDDFIALLKDKTIGAEYM